MGKRRIRIINKYSAEPMSEAEWEAAERILARLIARAYLADSEAASCASASATEGEDRTHQVQDADTA